jgi:hypothetical protein
MISAGIIDPTRVVRTAIVGAVSINAYYWSYGCWWAKNRWKK